MGSEGEGDAFLNHFEILASLYGSGYIPNFMETLPILVTGFPKMTAPSFKNLNNFRAISSVISCNWNLVVMSKSL